MKKVILSSYFDDEYLTKSYIEDALKYEFDELIFIVKGDELQKRKSGKFASDAISNIMMHVKFPVKIVINNDSTDSRVLFSIRSKSKNDELILLKEAMSYEISEDEKESLIANSVQLAFRCKNVDLEKVFNVA